MNRNANEKTLKNESGKIVMPQLRKNFIVPFSNSNTHSNTSETSKSDSHVSPVTEVCFFFLYKVIIKPNNSQCTTAPNNIVRFVLFSSFFFFVWSILIFAIIFLCSTNNNIIANLQFITSFRFACHRYLKSSWNKNENTI